MHADQELEKKLSEGRLLNASFDEVLYADDTIIFSHDVNALEELLARIEQEGARYGMKLNKTKCEALCIRGGDRIRFGDGMLVPRCDECKYLGCLINDKGDPRREVNKRISECFLTWKRLETFWKHSDCSVKVKLNIYDAVVRAKLIYGLETVQVNDSLKQKIDAFQLKGLRQILKMQTTFVNRGNTNELVFRRANALAGTTHKKQDIVPMSVFYERQRRNAVKEIIAAEMNNPIRSVCANENLRLIEHATKRIGRPRNNWWVQALTNFWNYLREQRIPAYRYVDLDVSNPDHISILIEQSNIE